MKILFLLAGLAGYFVVWGQNPKADSWIVAHNGRQWLKANREAPEKNRVTIRMADLKKNGHLFINFIERQPQQGWKRTIAAFDEKDNELLLHSGAIFKLHNPKLRSLAASGIRTIRLYTWSLPTDPDLAARIRIARMHLATIVLKE